MTQSLKDVLNYGLFQPASNGRDGKFLDEERLLREYPQPVGKGVPSLEVLAAASWPGHAVGGGEDLHETPDLIWIKSEFGVLRLPVIWGFQTAVQCLVHLFPSCSLDESVGENLESAHEGSDSGSRHRDLWVWGCRVGLLLPPRLSLPALGCGVARGCPAVI